MADIPDTLVLRKHRDLEGHRRDIWIRRAMLGLIAAVLVLALADVFGQSPNETRTVVPSATLRINTPAHIRGGLMYQTRFAIHATRELKHATLVLGPGWLQGLTMNTIDPSPLGQGSRDGSLVLELGHIASGQNYVLYIQYQVNPTTVGSRTQQVQLEDGGKVVLRTKRTLVVYP